MEYSKGRQSSTTCNVPGPLPCELNNVEAAQKYEKMMQSPEGHAMVEKMGGKLPMTIWLAEEVEL